MKRFAGVFNLTYKRFLDLQKAEAQTREAKIESALERVRSRTMAMHKSEEVMDVAGTLFEELQKLGFTFGASSIIIMDKDSGNMEYWIAGFSQEKFTESYPVKYFQHPYHNALLSSWKNGEKYLVYTLAGEEKKAYDEVLFTETGYKNFPQEEKKWMRETEAVIFSIAFMKHGALHWGPSPLTEEQANILQRFANVFEQSYTRFLDLQRAEAQAREATIEAALERVRGKAMAMHSSEDLSETVNVFFRELKLLGIVPIRCGVNELDEESRTSTVWVTTAFKQGESYEIIGKIQLAGHPVLEKIFEGWETQQEYYLVLSGADIKEYYEFMKPQLSFPHYPDSITEYGSYFYFKEGLVFAWTKKELSEEEKRIFRRFTAVISLTYKRYIELQKSEANAKDAVRQASLDRIRAEIASMRTTKDLERITPLIWNELTILGVPFIRCGVFIMDDEQQIMHSFLSTPDGKAIAAFHLPYSTPGNTKQILSHWQKKRIYTDHWDEAAFTEFAETLVKQGTLTSSEQYLTAIPDGGFYLHFLPFHQGMLYVGNTTQLGEEEIKLVQSLANAFSTAYARYEDFNKLEAAKQQVEKTLADLKQAQTQLIQSEKMASLGELTAGIAHEIQNPLNFVNNFSEVNKELLAEMAEEIKKGNYLEVEALAKHVEDNQEKINHHGKRADAIVKGMLQHSRSSSGIKEDTDINKLADEYLRLAYHGLRAKDKSFNTTLKTDYDENIGNINIIPQDMGRAILNLITNAFYAVAEKKKQQQDNYEPIVSVSTKKAGDKVLISVKDNGKGISQKVLDKIFQPFFTTKPTGQGTGLGLSLSYDIVKAHGGEIKVKSKEGEGSEFIIQQPI